MEFQTVVYGRRSATTFNAKERVSREDLEKILEAATMAPSSYNLQHWHFLVIDQLERKAALKEVAFEQQKVEAAPVVILVLGNLQAHRRIDRMVQDFIEKGYIGPEAVETAKQIVKTYYSDPDQQRIEAIRGASLAAMNLMLAAYDLGYDTCPMAGFDPERLRSTFAIPDHLFPVLLIPIGPKLEDKRPRKLRLPVDQVTTYNHF